MAKKPIADKPQTTTGQADKKPAARRTHKERAKTGTPEFHKRVKEEMAAQGLQHEQDRKPGKEFTYTREVFENIIARVATGESVRSICKDEGMPSRDTFFVWLYRDPSLADQYAHAKAISAYADEDELNEISDDGTNDWMEKRNKDGEIVGWQLNGEAVQRSRLRVETRRWLMERRMPTRFGQKVDVNHGVQPDNPLSSLIAAVSGRAIKPVEDPKE